jgi:hypothetical protein
MGVCKIGIEKVRISDAREIHVQISQWKGRENLDIRTYVKSAKYSGYTQKGVNVPVETGADLVTAIQKVLGGKK